MGTLKLVGDWAPCERKVAPLSFDTKLIMNLEAPVLPNGPAKFERSEKAGPSLFNLEFPSNDHAGIAILSNNHLMDFGLRGLEEATKIIKGAGWLYAGAGLSKSASQAPLIMDWSGTRVGVLARCETQFGIATEARAGVAGFDASIYDQIRLLKCEVDILIISVHAAAEMVPWPSPRRQETWRSLVDAGADVVHGHHAHVPQGWEEYNGGLIFYGLGNFCVDPDKWGWHPQGLWSLAPELTKTTRGIAMRPKTTVIDDLGDRIRIREADEAENTMHLTYLHQCNLPLGDSVLLEGLWQEASIKMYTEYFAKWLGFKSPSFFGSNLYIIRRRLERLKNLLLTGQGELDSCGPQRSRYLLWYHLFACDSHNDAIGTALGVLSGELEDMRTNQTAFMIDQLVFKR